MSDIWDWAKNLSWHIQWEAKASNLRADIAHIGTACGDCFKWMHSNSCPRETNVNGRRLGPSMNATICAQYVEAHTATERRDELNRQLAAMVAEKRRRESAVKASV